MRDRETHRADAAHCETLGNLLAGELAASAAPDIRTWQAIRASLGDRHRDRVWRRRTLRLAIPALAAAAIVLGWWAARLLPSPLTYAADGFRGGVQAGEIDTSAGQDGRLVFSDGSRIIVDGDSHGRVLVPHRSSAAVLVLSSGAADVSVVHRPGTRWAVEAGPFQVQVRGTQFRVAWMPAKRRFRLELTRGEVAIRSALFPATLVLRAGNVLEVDGDDYNVKPIDGAGLGAPPRMNADSLASRAVADREPTSGSGAAPDEEHVMKDNRTYATKAMAHRLAAAVAVAGAGLVAGCDAGLQADVRVNAKAQSPAVAAWTGRGDQVGIAPDGRLSGAMTGYAWVAGGAGSTIVSPPSCDASGCFQNTQGQLCSKGTIAALQCTGQGTTQIACDWTTNWGAMVGLDVSADRGAWQASAPTTISLAYRGGHAAYRLNAHVAGDPYAKQYCVDGYQSGQVVAAGMLKTSCWLDAGEALPDFGRVDQVSLQVLPNESAQTYDYCITGIAVNGSAGPPAIEHVAIEQNGRLAGPLSGYAWVAGGSGTSFVVPASCGTNGCFANPDARLCAKGTIAQVQCTGQAAPQLSCDWTSDWGGMIGLSVNAANTAWGSEAPSAVAISFTGAPADYLLTAHVAGTPESDIYCVDKYQPGQLVRAADMRTNCWSSSNAPLTGFHNVDKIGLLIMSSKDAAVPIDVCIDDVATR